MNSDQLLVHVTDQIATITINRPEILNALSIEMFHDLRSLLDDLETNDDVAVIILTGAGEKAFVAGGDIKAMVDVSVGWARDFALLAQSVLNRIEELSKPVIAAINGYALGGGCELAMACDIRIAADTAKLGQPEVKIGVIPGFAGTQRLARLVGKGKAKELIFTGSMIDAQEACRIGLVNKVVPANDLVAATRKMAAIIASRSRTAVTFSKQAIDNGLEMDIKRAGLYEADLFALCFSYADRREGMLSFIEKRSPNFTDR
jgi:enoyl-CoA hydratase